MKLDEKQLFNDWMLQNSEFNKNDLLVSIHEKKSLPYRDEIPEEEIRKIISIAQSSIKESGINPLCQTIGIIEWSWNNTEIQTPIWILPCEFKIDKIRKKVNLTIDDEIGFINPFLAKKLNELFDVNIFDTDFDETMTILSNLGLGEVDSKKRFVGNFHHHRFILLKEVEELAQCNVLSDCLHQVITGESINREKLNLPTEAILPYDTDHKKIFALFETENCVVQGPPGTGKSQLLTNLIGKLLLTNSSALLVSEKRSALEVVQKRLNSCGIDIASIIAIDGLTTHDFISELKKTWLFLEDIASTKKKEISIRKELEDNLQFTLDILNNPQLVGGVSYARFNQLKRDCNSNQFQFLSDVPTLVDYEKSLPLVQKIYHQNLQESVSILPINTLKNGQLSTLEETIRKTKDLVYFFEKIHPHFSYNDIDEMQYLSVVFQLFENEIAKKHAKIIQPQSKEQKKFLRLYSAYKNIQKTIEASSGILNDWIKIPSELELDYLTQLSVKKSLISSIKFKRRWVKTNRLPVKMSLASIEQLKHYLSQQKELKIIEEKFYQIGVTNLSEIDTIKSSLHLFSEEKWEKYRELSTEKKQSLQTIDTKITPLKNYLTTHYNLDKRKSVLSQLNILSEHLPQLVILENELKHINRSELNAISRSTSVIDYQQNVIGTHHSIFLSQYPTFSNFSLTELKTKTEAILQEEKKENTLMSETILQQLKSKFDHYHSILNTPSSQLTPDQKITKKKLKKGKSILVKEFSKTRQHPTLRELLHSEAGIWIKILKPIWLTNPIQLAKTFHLEPSIFDVCIIDEASQMPVQNAVGALHRSKRVIIAGDEQQMSPTSYFQSGTQEIMSILHHASYYLPKQLLTHHYRSKHPLLIAFSNQNFYENKLTGYPSNPIDLDCIRYHYCEDGRFINRTNTIEAQKVVSLLTTLLQSNKTIGIVAFSQDQIDAIWRLIPTEIVDEVTARIDNNTLFIKPLEKVQGDECEHLIISLGYAPDETGNFHLHFGPLNTNTGRNRLNVLFSRASETIDFICSIESSAIQWSENPSIQTLYKWLKFIEQPKQKNEIHFPLGLTPIIEKNNLILNNSFTVLPNALEFITTYSILKNRGWNISFQLD